MAQVTFPAYWANDAIAGTMAALGWVQEPRRRTWDPTSNWQQTLTYTGPSSTLVDFGNILVGDKGLKPFQLAIQPEGPNSRMTVVYYSNDFEGLMPRDPILTTWELDSNIGNESVLWGMKTLWMFRSYPDIVRRIQVAVALYENALGPLTNTYWQNASLPTSCVDITAMQNSLFNKIVATKPDGTPLIPVSDTNAGCILWHANQLYRMLLKGVTVSPRFDFVLRKTSVVFPKTRFGDAVVGSDVSASFWRVGYMLSYKALLLSEPGLSGDMQSLLQAGTLPRFWWWKQAPRVTQTSDSRFTVVQEFTGRAAFEPWTIPWVTAPGETFTTGQFSPSRDYDSVIGTDPMPAGGGDPLGVKPSSGCYQWTREVQEAVYGNQGDFEDLL